MSGGLHKALEDLMACMTWNVSHMMHHVSWNMPARITWRARVLPWDGRKGGTSSRACPRPPWCRTWRGENDFAKDSNDDAKLQKHYNHHNDQNNQPQRPKQPTVATRTTATKATAMTAKAMVITIAHMSCASLVVFASRCVLCLFDSSFALALRVVDACWSTELAPFSFAVRSRPMAPWPAARVRARPTGCCVAGCEGDVAHTTQRPYQEHAGPQCCLTMNSRCKLNDYMDCKDSTDRMPLVAKRTARTVCSRLGLLRWRLSTSLSNYFCCWSQP